MRPVKILTIVQMAVFICLFFVASSNAQNWPMVNACKERTSWADVESELLPPFEKTIEFSESI